VIVKGRALFGTLLLIATAAPAQDVRPAGVPPGAVQAGQAEAKAERDLPPPVQARRSRDLSKLTQEADELSKLAQTIPLDVSAINKGMLPKDVTQKLKQIEKLSKQLRVQLNP
jgi:hypothetical protein